MRIFICFGILSLSVFLSKPVFGQSGKDSLLYNATLDSCIIYAIQHQPGIQQSLLDEQITERMIRGRLADWFPQINFSFTADHYFQLPTVFFQGDPVKSGVANNGVASVTLTQNIFNRDVVLASQSADDVRRQSRENTASNKINVAVNVSKAYYEVLLTRKQILTLEDDIVRLTESEKDSYNQYRGGIVDKTDYKRATIALNNSKAQKRSYEELLKSRYAYLKQLMGYPPGGDLPLIYDSLKMEREIVMDTLQTANYESRIEYRQLLTTQKLQMDNLKYYKWGYLPTVSLVGNYNFSFLNDDLLRLYSNNYPSSYAGLAVSLPIFQGTKRSQQVRQAELELKRVDYDILSLRSSVNTEFEQAMGSYKSYLNQYYILRDNLELAKDVYNTIELQYKAGVKAYLELITAESDLRAAQINYADAVYQVLSSKIDVQKALGLIKY